MSPAFAGVSAVVESEPLVDDLAGQVQDRGVVVQDEAGVGGQHDPVQLEGEPVRVLAGGKLVLLERSGRESPDQRVERVPISSAAAAKKQPPGKVRRCR
jgi:hypothetical protein